MLLFPAARPSLSENAWSQIPLAHSGFLARVRADFADGCQRGHPYHSWRLPHIRNPAPAMKAEIATPTTRLIGRSSTTRIITAFILEIADCVALSAFRNVRPARKESCSYRLMGTDPIPKSISGSTSSTGRGRG